MPTSPKAREAAATLLASGFIKSQSENLVAAFLDTTFSELAAARAAFMEALQYDQTSFPVRDEVLERRWLASDAYKRLTGGAA